MYTQELVWYASYGSNMNDERFMCYIAGGIPVGGTREYVGCSNKIPPTKNIPLELPHSLYFAGYSKVWTGGLAFISIEPAKQVTKARAYLISLNQLEEIVMQESWREELNVIDLQKLKISGHLTLGDGKGNYDELIYCGDREAYPVISFTSPRQLHPWTKPAPDYVRMISSGLRESHHMSSEAITKYLSTVPGIVGNYTLDELLSIVASSLIKQLPKK